MTDHAADVEKAILAQLDNPDSPLLRRVTRNNQIWLHNFRVETTKVCRCHLLGCPNSFAVTLIPNQVVYPKYCASHRSEFRRGLFRRATEGFIDATVAALSTLSALSIVDTDP